MSSQPVLSVEIMDVEAALANFTSPSPIVNLTMRLDSRGHLAAANAVLVSNVTESSTGGVAGAIKGLFGKKDKEKTEDSAVEGENDETSALPVKGEKIALKFRERHLGIKAMNGEEKRTAMAR
jgi:hypoxia up-regulated 1